MKTIINSIATAIITFVIITLSQNALDSIKEKSTEIHGQVCAKIDEKNQLVTFKLLDNEERSIFIKKSKHIYPATQDFILRNTKLSSELFNKQKLDDDLFKCIILKDESLAYTMYEYFRRIQFTEDEVRMIEGSPYRSQYARAIL